MKTDNFQLYYFTTFYFLVVLFSYSFLGKIIQNVSNIHKFLKKHHALSRTISVSIIVGLTLIIAIPLQETLEKVFETTLEYTQFDVLKGYFIGKSFAVLFLFIMTYYFSK